MSYCSKCGKSLNGSEKFCGSCGTPVFLGENTEAKKEVEQKSFRLDTSKEGNRRTIMGLGLLVGIKLLGPVIGSYMIAGAVLGASLFFVEYLISKGSSEAKQQ